MNRAYKIIGRDDVGGKSTQLLADAPLIKKAGLGVPPSVSFTPQFFRNFLERSGALEAKSPQEAQERICKTEFHKQELQKIGEGIMYLCKDEWHSLIVRSDESANGIGLWKSKVAESFGDPDYLFNFVLNNIHEVLASDFAEATQEFKRVKNMVDTPGVLLMPAIDSRLMSSCLGKVNDWWLASFFNGGTKPFMVVRQNTNNMIAFEEEPIGGLAFNNWLYDIKKNGSISKLEKWGEMIDSLVAQTGPRYFEIVAGANIPFELFVVQSAPLSAESVSPPNCSHVLVQSKDVIGTKVVKVNEIHTILTADRKPSEEDAIYNKEHSDYVLVHQMPDADFFTAKGLRYYSNAGALILGQRANVLPSHAGGFIRQLGIPVLSCDNTSKLIFLGKEEAQKLVIYADEFHKNGPRGFVGLE